MTMNTIGELAAALTIKHRQSVPEWKLRRVCDQLFPELPRIGVNRAVPEQLVPQIEAELIRQNWLPAAGEVEA